MTKVTLLVLLVTCPAASMLLAACCVIFFRFLEKAFRINKDATIFIVTVNEVYLVSRYLETKIHQENSSYQPCPWCGCILLAGLS
jgi:hypothetical protein